MKILRSFIRECLLFEAVNIETVNAAFEKWQHFFKNNRNEFWGLEKDPTTIATWTWEDTHDPVAYSKKLKSSRFKEYCRTFDKKIEDFELENIEKTVDQAIHAYNNIDETPDAPHDAPLGQWALPRITGRPQLLAVEPNTKIEDELERALIYCYGGHPLEPKMINLIKGCRRKGWYTNIFRPPAVEFAYRIISLSEEQFHQQFGFLPNEDVGEKQLAKTIKSTSQTNTGHASSWSIQSTDNMKDSWENPFRNKNVPYIAVELCASLKENVDTFLDGLPFRHIPDLYLSIEIFAIEDHVKINSIRWQKQNPH